MVLKRMRDILVATIHEGLDKIENPVVMINQYLRDMEAEIDRAKASVVKHKTLAESFMRQGRYAADMAEKRSRQAQLAFDAGEEDLARKAIGERKYYEERAEYYKDLADKASHQAAELEKDLRRLQDKYEALRDRKFSLIARANAAMTKERIQASLHRYNGESALREFERMEDRIREMEIRANVAAFYGARCADAKLAKLEWNDEIEKEIEHMRKQKALRENKPEDTDSAEERA